MFQFMTLSYRGLIVTCVFGLLPQSLCYFINILFNLFDSVLKASLSLIMEQTTLALKSWELGILIR